jgi:hypothetical protein
VSSSDDLSHIAERLIERANALGGPDNITAVIARFEGNLQETMPGDRVGHMVFPLADDDATPVAQHVRYTERTTGPMPAVGTDEFQAVSQTREAPTGMNRALMLAVGLTMVAALLLLALRQLRGDERSATDPDTAIHATANV